MTTRRVRWLRVTPSGLFRAIVMQVGVLIGRLALVAARNKGDVDGVKVVVLTSRVTIADAEQRLGVAMQLLSSSLPRLHRRVRSFADHFLIWDGLYCATNRCGGVMIDVETLESPATELSASLVHEATHLRLRAAGCESTFESRPRIEAICNGEADWVRLNLTGVDTDPRSLAAARPSASEIAEYRQQHSITLARRLRAPRFVGRAIAWLRDGSAGRHLC